MTLRSALSTVNGTRGETAIIIQSSQVAELVTSRHSLVGSLTNRLLLDISTTTVYVPFACAGAPGSRLGVDKPFLVLAQGFLIALYTSSGAR